MAKLIRITTVPLSLNVLLPGQMRYMREQGMDVLMVAGEGPDWKEVLPREECRHAIVPMSRKITPVADLKALWQLYRLFKKEKPDIVHSHTPKAGLLAMLAAKMAGVKFRIHTIAGLRFMTAKGKTRKLLVAMEKLTARAATHVWPNSFSLRDYIVANKLVDPRKLEVIGLGSSNGINLKRYSPGALNASKLEEIKSALQYDPSLKYLVSVGRIVHDKGMDELVKAFVQLSPDHPDVRLVLVGAFEDELDPVSDEAREILRTHPQIIQVGWSDAVEYYMSLAFALIHPSHREGFPNVLLQAGAMGCPVICSAIEGNVDIVTHGETGLLFPVKDAAALAAQVSVALADPAALRQYAVNLRQKIESHFDQPVIHNLLHKRYMSLLQSGR